MIFTPLYKDADPGRVLDSRQMNAGLWYDKFCHFWVRDKDDNNRIVLIKANQRSKDPELQKDGKRRWVETVAGKRVGDSQLLDHTYGRRRLLVEASKGTLLSFKTTGRFVTGLGRQHPVENGFAWHQTLGTPYLPGSSVKGLVRAWALEEYGDNDGKTLNADARRIFGEPENGEDRRTGSVIFMDALPHAPVKLEADVMTPHYQDYYQGNEPPADWISPNPIPFLVVAKGAEFYFSLLPRTPGDTKDIETAAKWLGEALEWLGAGAKTSVGYGRLEKVSVPPPPINWEITRKAAQEDARRRRLTPVERAREDAQNMSEKEAIVWTREHLDVDVDRNAEIGKAQLEIIINRFYERWDNGHPDTLANINISANKLRDEYAHKLVPPRTKEEQQAARFAHLPKNEATLIIELKNTPSSQLTNPLRDAATQAIADGSWSIEGLQELLKLMEGDNWNHKRAKKNKSTPYKNLKKHLNSRKKQPA